MYLMTGSNFRANDVCYRYIIWSSCRIRINTTDDFLSNLHKKFPIVFQEAAIQILYSSDINYLSYVLYTVRLSQLIRNLANNVVFIAYMAW